MVENAVDAVGSSQVVVLILADASAIEDTLEAPGVKAALAGKTVLQMGTIGTIQARRNGLSSNRLDDSTPWSLTVNLFSLFKTILLGYFDQCFLFYPMYQLGHPQNH